MSKQDALIFGVKGQDGSFLAEQLLEEGYSVVGVSRRSSTQNTDRIKHLLTNNAFTLVEGDITDSGNIFYLLKKFGPKYIYNLAAQSHVGTSFTQPELTWNVTALGHQKLLEIIMMMGLDTRVYFAASSEMFGDQYSISPENSKLIGVDMMGKPVYQLADGSFTLIDRLSPFQDENTKLNPQSPYAIAKVAAYHTNRLYRDAYGLFTCSGILFNHESERRGEEFVTRKITRWLGRYLVNNTIPKLQLGNLHSKRDWGYAGDYTKVMKLIIEHDKPDDFAVGTGISRSVLEFLTDAFIAAGLDPELTNELVVVNEDLKRPAEVPVLRASPLKANKTFNINYSGSYHTMIKKMVENDIDLARNEKV